MDKNINYEDHAYSDLERTRIKTAGANSAGYNDLEKLANASGGVGYNAIEKISNGTISGGESDEEVNPFEWVTFFDGTIDYTTIFTRFELTDDPIQYEEKLTYKAKVTINGSEYTLTYQYLSSIGAENFDGAFVWNPYPFSLDISEYNRSYVSLPNNNTSYQLKIELEIKNSIPFVVWNSTYTTVDNDGLIGSEIEDCDELEYDAFVAAAEQEKLKDIDITFDGITYHFTLSDFDPNMGSVGASVDPQTMTVDWTQYPFVLVPFDKRLVTQVAGEHSLKVKYSFEGSIVKTLSISALSVGESIPIKHFDYILLEE